MRRESISSLKKKADIVFSLYIRQRDKRCFTCNSAKNLQCGHFISRSHNATRYDPENAKAQCVGCNVFKNGNMAEYSYRLLQKLGKERFNALIKRGREIKQFKIQELQEIIK